MSSDVHVGGFNILPPVVKNLLIINTLFFLAKITFSKFGLDMDAWLGLHFFGAGLYRPWQVVTYMFMHGDFGHLFFNMFALWMFGAAIENYWGSRRFLFYYIATGIGAGLTHYAVLAFQMYPDLALINQYLDAPSFNNLMALAQGHTFHIGPNSGEIYSKFLAFQQLAITNNDTDALNQATTFIAEYKEYYLNLPNIIGASGSVFGLLLAFGMLFPNSQIYLYFLLPIKAKWFVILYGLAELVFGITGTQDGVAHFAHLGGMLVGLLLILYWRKKSKQNYMY